MVKPKPEIRTAGAGGRKMVPGPAGRGNAHDAGRRPMRAFGAGSVARMRRNQAPLVQEQSNGSSTVAGASIIF